MNILFLGTPEFAAPSLRKIVESGHNVVAVVTAPDRPAGRGRAVKCSDVKIAAQELGLKILQPEKLRDEEFLAELRGLDIDLGIVIAFRMLPEVVWSMPRFGTFNLHASLLPEYRGAAPINHAIINGDKVSGVTTFMLNAEIDKGAIIGQVEEVIHPCDNVGTLYERLMNIGSDLVIESIKKIESGEVKPIEQSEYDESKLRPAPKIFKDNCLIDWSMSGERVVNLVRGLSPYPAAWTNLISEGEQTTAKIFEAEFTPCDSNIEVGTIQSDNKKSLRVKCSDGWVEIKSIQVAGKKRLATGELLLGMRNITNYKTV
ncbi:MAG: methionyl-tRNA formyltransferase [Rikenellaceae bacterium]